MTRPRISVIIPVYKVEAYLRRCIDSIINQSFRDLEIILVDDGSPDNCGVICDEYACRDARIHVIHQENMGLYGARNTGLEAASGEYISFVDSDDWIEADMYACMLEIIDDCHPDMVRFGLKKMLSGKIMSERKMAYANGFYKGELLNSQRLDIISNEHILDYKKERLMSACTNLYRRELVMEYGLRFVSEREILNEDYLVVLQVFMAAESVYIIDKTFYCYDTREGSITMSYRENMFERKKKLFQMYCRSVNTQDKNVRIRLKNFYIDCVYACVVNECGDYRGRADSIATIRDLLDDERLQKYLSDNRKLAGSGKAKCICFLMRHRLAVGMYGGYRLLKYLRKGRMHK